MQIFSTQLQRKLDALKERRRAISLSSLPFASPLILAPMSSICTAPFRLLMQELGAGGSVSELISCHGINYGGERSLRMLKIDSRERRVGIQLFGEDAAAMARAAQTAQDFGPRFIDINMGCPVRKVVTKGAGSALLKKTSELGRFFARIKKALDIPLSIKIRTGWDEHSINAGEVVRIAHSEGIEFVAIHGRTRAQAYRGQADWNLIEDLAGQSPLPIVGNGDLHSPGFTRKRMLFSSCHALMLGRGCLRFPFIFLESFLEDGEASPFGPLDYWEVVRVYCELLAGESERHLLISARKFIVWLAMGFPRAAFFRQALFQCEGIKDVLRQTRDYFSELASEGGRPKELNLQQSFMAGGHG